MFSSRKRVILFILAILLLGFYFSVRALGENFCRNRQPIDYSKPGINALGITFEEDKCNNREYWKVGWKQILEKFGGY